MERLTRITILLAKVTILFIPVSVMSAYFAIPIEGVSEFYTVTTYWASFAVIMGLSLVGLVVFGKLSGTQESQPIYTSLTEAFFKAWRSFFGSRSKTKYT